MTKRAGPIRAWSFSRLSVFEQCKLRAKLAYVDRIPEPERPLPKGKTEHANDRGSRIHDAAELFVRGDQELAKELRSFEGEFHKLRELYERGLVALEEEWAVDENWEPVDWRSPDAWARLKLDALVFSPDGKTATAIDYKTGRKFGNEVKHAEQGQLYQLGTFLRYPELEHIVVEFWYTDQDDITQTEYRRSQGLKFLRNFDDRGAAMTGATTFPPNPNQFTCKWCPYGPAGTRHCTKGIQK